ncbi:MAG: LPS assembly lipoprotein LptE [Bacteroidota bacterium]
MKTTRCILLLCLMACLIIPPSCKVNYSFTGASIAPDVKTVSIQYFSSFAPLAKPTYSQVFTEALRDIFLSQTNLSFVQKNGDLQFEGAVTAYNAAPIAIQGTGANGLNQAAQNRLSITVKVKFVNNKDDKQNFETTFTRFADFPSTTALAAEEDRLIKEINNQLVQDIFNKAVINW